AARIAFSSITRRTPGSSTPLLIEIIITPLNHQITQSPDHPIPCTWSSTRHRPSVFSRPLRSPKRSSIAPHPSGILRSRCLIATASTARPGFIKRPGRLEYSRLLARSSQLGERREKQEGREGQDRQEGQEEKAQILPSSPSRLVCLLRSSSLSRYPSS